MRLAKVTHGHRWPEKLKLRLARLVLGMEAPDVVGVVSSFHSVDPQARKQSDRFTVGDGTEVGQALVQKARSKVTLTPGELVAADAAALRAAGVSDAAATEGLYVCAAFNVYDRLADSLGFDIPTDEEFKTHPKILLRLGYKK